MPRDARERNEAVFRVVNERIEDVGTTLVPDDVPMQFLCECDDPDCLEKISATRAEYEAIRAVATQFVVLPGHEDPAVEHVVQQAESFLVVEKEGQAGHEAQESDPRRT
jgi:hypothetical protein